MFDKLSSGLLSALSFLHGKRKLTEQNIQEGLQAVQQALLEADVNYAVAQEFIRRVADDAVGQQLLQAVRPDQQFVKIVYDQLTLLMGPVNHEFRLRDDEVTVIMLCGLQGSGKTTTCGKLARFLQTQGARPMLVAADLQRPAAIAQLKLLGEQLGVPVHAHGAESNPVDVCVAAVAAAKSANAVQPEGSPERINVVILDTAGRLHVDEPLMAELRAIDERVMPDRILFVCDAMTGQDAAQSARAFNAALDLDAVILTKLDGDARGGAALSIKHVTGVGIQFAGVGEQLDRLELFHPERMASRILGMGDVVSLVEKAQQQMDAEEALRQQVKLARGTFTLTDFQQQMEQVRKMGPIREIMKMIPGMGKLVEAMGSEIDPEDDLNQINGIINAMTAAERETPEIVDSSRRRRIAWGSGVDPSDVNKLLQDFTNMANMMQKLAGMGLSDRFQVMKDMANGAMFPQGSPPFNRLPPDFRN